MTSLAFTHYKHSGVEWLGDIPANWVVKRLKFVSQLASSGVWGEDPVSEIGGCRVATTANIDTQGNINTEGMTIRSLSKQELELGECQPGDIIVVKSSGSATNVVSGKAGLVREEDLPICFSNFCLRVRPTPTVLEPRFLWRFLNSEVVKAQIRLMVATTTYPNLQVGEYASFYLPVPGYDAQRTIADYLDRETVRLDGLVAAKQRVLGLLAEKRRALITRAVTRGLDPRSPLRDSGISWLGEIPAHWELIPLRFLVDIVGGATPDTGKAEFWDGDIPWVSPKDMKRDEIKDVEDHVSTLALSSSALRLIDPVVVLIVVRGMILAHSFPTAVTTQPVTINQDMKALRCRELLEPRYLRDFLRGLETQLVSIAEESAHGTRKLESEVLGQFQVCVPPIDEQRAIVAHIATEAAKLDALRSATERTIALLKERRTALITAAVTGQIEVPEVA